MASLIPMLSTPLLKVPILLGRASIMQASCVPPPNPPAKAEEKQRFGMGVDPLTLVRGDVLCYGMLFVAWTSSLCEAVIAAATQFPSELSDRILSTLTIGPPYGPNTLQISPQWLLGVSLIYIGGLTRVACHNTLGSFFTWNLAVREDHKLVTSGPYSIVRHPSYTGMLLIGAGNILCMFAEGSWWKESGLLETPLGKVLKPLWVAWWISVPLALVLRVPKEDAVLKREFGEEWQAWSKKTPYKLIPFIY
ncbi:hypothetical protein CERSUDRAFT_82211 [Gelatoporia subvermispora B]|uniref:Protein-S-isoprenylcysteine O-methyltransferase n=1 Tax=Ceriporiopsis subvermispora (strain B) TaxID=914234 RepID=M2QLW1_CERS8|nr:hypothetical protein CERSUDRAFT_82211 [Gelatoporia subvermispora B]